MFRLRLQSGSECSFSEIQQTVTTSFESPFSKKDSWIGCPLSIITILLFWNMEWRFSKIVVDETPEVSFESGLNTFYFYIRFFQSVAGSYNDLQVLCSVDRLEKSVQTDREAQKTFNRIKTKLQNILKQLIKSYEKRLKEKKAQIAKKNKIIKGLKVDIKDLKQKLALSTSKAKAIGQWILNETKMMNSNLS